MARLEDKVAEIKDPELRGAIAEEVKALKAQKKFGLVFEQHQPEVVRVYRVPVRAGLTVAKKASALTETYRVTRVRDGMAELVKDADDSRESAPVDSLTVVRRMGQAIHPALVPVEQVQNSEPSQPHHILIEADNYHALQLLDYLYAGKVDCIYIDPPYNTGARDWKYNNDYIDGNDGWRHSKWLCFMQKRLQLARRLLNPQTGVLIITIDQNEVHHLSLLLEEMFPESERTLVTIVIHGRGNAGTNFDRVEEFAIFVAPNDRKTIQQRTINSYNSVNANNRLIADTRTFVRTGNNSTPDKRPGMDYPIWVNEKTGAIRIGEPRKKGEQRTSKKVGREVPIWPLDERGNDRVWRHNPDSAKKGLASGLLITVFDEKNQRWRVRVTSMKATSINHRTVWQDSSHAAKNHGTSLLTDILGDEKFSFPKSLYAVRDCIAAVTARNKTALIADFFAGSGTTLNAVNLLNATDGGQRQCILVTNNEVSEEEASTMTARGLQPGDEAWDAVGICRSVTWPRNKYTILGKRDDGTVLNGEYFTGRTVSIEKPRTIRQLGFADGRTLSLAQRKQLVALVPGLPQSKLVADAPWFLDDDLPVSVLWDVQQAAAWLEELAEADHLTDILVVTTESRLFNALAAQIKETLGPLSIEEDEKRPIAAGFAVNLAYFKLDFLEPTEVAMGKQFAAILPMLWMMAGAKGVRPEAPDAHAHWLIPDGCPFAVLMREGRFREFIAKTEGRTDLTHVFLVTNSDSAYHDMRSDLPEHIEVVQLYKNYLENFKINTQRR